MTARQFYYGEGVGEQTATSSTPVDVATLTFTPDANSDYLLIYSALQQCTVTLGQSVVQLWDNTASAELSANDNSAKDTTDYWAGYGIHKATFGASPPSQTYKLRAIDFSSGNTLVKEGRIVALKMGADDKFAAADSDTTTTSSTLQDKTTLTFTPGSAGDYLIIATCRWRHQSTSSDKRIALDVDGTLYGDATMRETLNDVNESNVWGTIAKVTLTAASHTIKIQHASVNNSTTTNIKFARIVAIRLDGFDNNYYGEARANANDASGAYQDRVTLTATPYAVDHLVLASALRAISSATTSALTKVVDGGGDLIAEATQEGRVSSTTVGVEPWLQIIKRTGSGSSTTWKLQYRTETSSRTDIWDAALAVLQLGNTLITGTIAQVLPKSQQALAAAEKFTGTVAQTLPKAAQAAAGGVAANIGTIAQVLPKSQQALAAAEKFTGTAAQTLPKAAQAASAAEVIKGTIAQTLPRLAQSAAGVFKQFAGTIAQALRPLAQALAGKEIFTGTVAQTLPRLGQAVSGPPLPAGPTGPAAWGHHGWGRSAFAGPARAVTPAGTSRFERMLEQPDAAHVYCVEIWPYKA